MLNAHMASMGNYFTTTVLGNGLITASQQQQLLLRQYYCNDYLHFVADAASVFAASAS